MLAGGMHRAKRCGGHRDGGRRGRPAPRGCTSRKQVAFVAQPLKGRVVQVAAPGLEDRRLVGRQAEERRGGQDGGGRAGEPRAGDRCLRCASHSPPA